MKIRVQSTETYVRELEIADDSTPEEIEAAKTAMRKRYTSHDGDMLDLGFRHLTGHIEFPEGEGS